MAIAGFIKDPPHSEGASSRMACTLVPDIPNEDTAALLGARSSVLDHSVTACGTKKSRFDLGEFVEQPVEVQHRWDHSVPQRQDRLD
nr:hypothetical protein [Mycobacterium riyadhense]